MPAIQSLKKQLRGICSTQKLTKAMQTVATVKFSKLNAVYGHYKAYGKQCERLLEQYGGALLEALGPVDHAAPAAVIVMASNKGLCGSFNSEVLGFATEQIRQLAGCRVFACGKKAIAYFKGRNVPLDAEFVLDDVPTYRDSCDLLEHLLEERRSGRISRVYLIYPQYGSMMKQMPVLRELLCDTAEADDELRLLVPDRQTLLANTAATVFRAVFYERILETALGAQAATLMTMRSAYDTATDYRLRLEGQINRMRQSAVTADVLETATEWD